MIDYKLSIIITSINRFDELKRFVDSLNNQVEVDFSLFQLIFIDQGNNECAFSHLNKEIKFEYIKVPSCSLSHARNIGLKRVKGSFVCFPDDDCWLCPNTLWNIVATLDKGYDGVFIKATDKNGIPIGKFPKGKKMVSMFDHCGACSITIFLRYIPELFFDENLGVGSPYNFAAGEETDYIVNYIKKWGGKIVYRDDIIIHHPIGMSSFFDNDYLKKKYNYGRGIGYVLRKNQYKKWRVFLEFSRPLCGMLFYALNLNFRKAKLSIYFLRGKLEGYVECPKYLKK